MKKMSEECTHDCSTCSANCGSRERKREDFWEKTHEDTHVKKVIAVLSGKGGVGKSMVSSLLAVELNRRGHKTAVLDSDILGPSIPRLFGMKKERATGRGDLLVPVESKTGVKVMSVNLLLEEETTPVLWRGPVVSGVITQFWTQTDWGDVDFMVVDMPPGTGDVALTVMQSIPVDGIIIVTSPQELVSVIVEKATRMAEAVGVPILGIVENMSYMECPDCGKRIEVFGESHTDEVAFRHDLDILDKLPFNPKFAKAADDGAVELCDSDMLKLAADAAENLLK